MTAERDAAVGYNLNLQGKLSSLEEDYAGLLQINRRAMKQLNKSTSQADMLSKEIEQLAACVKQLENRCAMR